MVRMLGVVLMLAFLTDNKFKFLFCFLFLFLLMFPSSVFSIRDFVVSTPNENVDSLRIVPVYNPYFEAGENYKLFFEPYYNYTPVKDNLSCSLRLYQDSRVYNQDVIVDGLNRDSFYFDINNSNWSKPGMYGAIISCNTTVNPSNPSDTNFQRGGFVQFTYRVQGDEFLPFDSRYPLVALAGLVVFLIGLLWITFNIDPVEHFQLRLLLLFVSVITLLGVLNFSLTLLNSLNSNMLISNVVGTMYHVGVYSMFLFFAYFIFFYFIPKIFGWINDNLIRR